MPQDFPDDAIGGVLKSLRRAGSNLAERMLFEFQLEAGDRDALAACEDALDPREYTCTYDYDEDDGIWTCHCAIEIVPSYDVISDLERQFELLADDLGVSYAGFDTFGNHQTQH